MAEGSVSFKRKQRYTAISNNAVRDKRMSLAVRGLFVLMLSLPQDKPYKLSYLAKAGGVGKDTLCRYLSVLERYGYLKREQKHEKGGQFGANTYVLDDDPDAPCMDFPYTVNPNTEKPCTEEPNAENADAKRIPVGKNNPPISPQGGKRASNLPKWKPERFEAFWDFYRKNARGEDRAGAVREWDRLKPDDALIEQIGKALLVQIQSDDWKRGVGIPYACRYLKNRRWEDELPAPADTRAPAREEAWGWRQ